MLKRLITSFFFSNYFYGICAVALSIEASLQQQVPLNPVSYYLFVFAATVLYYTHAYLTEKKSRSSNPRTLWYSRHYTAVRVSQVLLTVAAAAYVVMLVYRHYYFLHQLSPLHWGLLLVFPCGAVLYYGINNPPLARFRLRNIGWLKPFIIGFVWAGLVTIYPVLFYNIGQEIVYLPDLTGVYLFVKNMMFITVLCIMFDIKDYAADHNRQLKTFVVKAGLRKTIFRILIPLCIAGLGSFVYYGIARQFSIEKILLNTIPFLLLIAVAYSMHRRKSILYYLIVIDGLMLAKAAFGSVAMVCF